MRVQLTIFFISFVLVSCLKEKQNSKVYFLIPNNYTGWVNIVYNDTSGRTESFNFNNGYVYLISKKPSHFTIPNDIFPAGKYDMNYCYYDTDTIIALKCLEYPKRNIFYEGLIATERDNKIVKSFSFYVSKEPLPYDSIIPDNPLKSLE